MTTTTTGPTPATTSPTPATTSPDPATAGPSEASLPATTGSGPAATGPSEASLPATTSPNPATAGPSEASLPAATGSGPAATGPVAGPDVAALPCVAGPGETTAPAAGMATSPVTGPGGGTSPSTSTGETTVAGSGVSTAPASGRSDAAAAVAGSGVSAPPVTAGSGVAAVPAAGVPASPGTAAAATAAVGAAGADTAAAGTAAAGAAGAGTGASGSGAGAVPDAGSGVAVVSVTDATDADAAGVVGGGGVPGCLEDVVGDVEAFFRVHWAGQPVVLRAPGDLSGLITEEEMWEEVECGLLSRPYFTVFNEGVRTAISDMTRRRRVVGHELPGFIEPAQIREDFAQGATFKFNQAEHWHPRIRALVKAMEPHFAGGLEAFVFLSPPGKTAMQAHTDGAHVFILQVAGVKDWVVGRIDATSTSDSSLHEGPIADHARREVTLRPGDVLYMPHGTPHYATAREGNSIHVAITIEEPTAENLAEVVLAGFLGSAPVTALHECHHQYRLGERTELLRRALAEYLRGVDEDAVTAAAVTLRRQHR
ncbi:cupin domain-containing protein [Streptomyces sp. NPDC005481]|uniref:JmjC domain-containing protein n=1 Tax=Streptomyces sp. NPDC005481 TaxID=3154881 RepID=UPI0033ABE95D